MLRLADVGNNVIDVRTGDAGKTVITLIELIVPLDALILELPDAIAVTKPLAFTVATVELLVE